MKGSRKYSELINSGDRSMMKKIDQQYKLNNIMPPGANLYQNYEGDIFDPKYSDN